MKNATKTMIAICFALGLSLASCNKISDLLRITINLENSDASFTIPILPITGAATYGIDVIALNLDSIIKAQDNRLGANNIKEVHLTSCVLHLTDADANNNAAAFEACTISIASNTKTSPVLMAGIDPNPDTLAYNLNLPVNSTLDLKDYFLNAQTFTYTVSGRTRKTTSKPLACNLTIKYAMVVGL